jgi:hypothetical protein
MKIGHFNIVAVMPSTHSYTSNFIIFFSETNKNTSNCLIAINFAVGVKIRTVVVMYNYIAFSS